MSRKVRRYVAGGIGVIIGAGIAGFGSGIGSAYGSHLMRTGRLPLPGAPKRGAQRASRQCKVKIADRFMDYFEGVMDGGYRVVAECGGDEVGQIQVSVGDEALATPRCKTNARTQRRKHQLRSPGAAVTTWSGVDEGQQRTGLGTEMYRAAQQEAHDLGVPLVPDACLLAGSTSDAAWRVWQRKLAWEGRIARRRRRGRRR